MKTKEELNKLKEEVEAVNDKLRELTPEEMEMVTGGNCGQYYNNTDIPSKPGEVITDAKELLPKLDVAMGVGYMSMFEESQRLT